MSRIITNQFLGPSTIDAQKLHDNLHPAGNAEQLMYGFLGKDEQLEEVITQDEKTLVRLGLSHEQFAKTIEDIFEHMPAKINGNGLHLFGYIHSPVCPWDDFCAVSLFDYSEKITEIWLCNPKYYWRLRILLKWWNKEERLIRLKKLVEKDWVMVLSDLHPHLIRSHKFFEGHATPYRVDPERFIRFVGIKNIHPYSQ